MVVRGGPHEARRRWDLARAMLAVLKIMSASRGLLVAEGMEEGAGACVRGVRAMTENIGRVVLADLAKMCRTDVPVKYGLLYLDRAPLFGRLELP